MNQTLVIHFSHLRAYHLARLHAAEQACGGMFASIQGIALYDHTGGIPADEKIARPSRPPEVLLAGVSGGNPRRAVREALDRLRPSAIAICGYATPDARECLRWARRNGSRAILMTETRECDAPRVWWKEWIKSRIVRRYHGALCGGPAARTYLEKLGMPSERIAEGYDVVDNGYFREKTLEIVDSILEEDNIESGDSRLAKENANDPQPERSGDGRRQSAIHDLPQYPNNPISNIRSPYFLASNRFIERKNLARLINAYASYIQKSKFNNQQSSIWHLCLLGDGELKSALIAQCHELGLTVIESAPWDSSLPPESCALTPVSSSLTPVSSYPATASRLASPCSTLSHFTPLATSGQAGPSSPTVFFPGWRSYADLPRFYAHAGAFVHPAILEPWGLVINEAMASSIPCIVTPGTGAAEVLIRHGETGLLCDSALPDALARSMAEIAAMPARRRHDLGHAARLHLERVAPCIHFGRSLAALISRSS